MNQHSVLRISQRSVRISTGIWNHKVLENNSLFSKAGNWFLVKQYDERQFLPKHSTWKYENDLQEHLKYKIRYRFIYFFSYGKNRMYSYCINHKLWRRYFFLFCSELDNNCEYAFYWKIFHFPPSNPPTVYASSFTLLLNSITAQDISRSVRFRSIDNRDHRCIGHCRRSSTALKPPLLS